MIFTFSIHDISTGITKEYAVTIQLGWPLVSFSSYIVDVDAGYDTEWECECCGEVDKASDGMPICSKCMGIL
jgi:hypothetical protein